MKGKKWEDDKNELYNEVRMMTLAGQEIQTLHFIKINIFYRLKQNKLDAISAKDKDLTEVEISLLKKGNKLKEPYLKSVLILAQSFGIDLTDQK